MLLKFEVYNMCHVSKSILELSLVGVKGYVLKEVHQRLPHVFDEYENGKIKILIKN